MNALSPSVSGALLDRVRSIDCNLDAVPFMLEDALRHAFHRDRDIRVAAKAFLVNLVWTLCVGPQSEETTCLYGTRLSRIGALLGWNESIYAFRHAKIEDRQPVQFRLSDGKESIHLNFEWFDCFSGAIPLSRLGMEKYLLNEVSAFEFASSRELIVPDDAEPTPFVYISAVVQIDQIPLMVSRQLVEPWKPLTTGSHAIALLFDHLAGLLPALGFDESGRVITSSNYRTMLVVSPISNRGMGEPYLRKCAFREWEHLPRDISDHLKLVFDPSEINLSSQVTEQAWLERLREVVWMFSKRCIRPETGHVLERFEIER